MREGRVIASGPLPQTMTSEALTATYGIPVRVARFEGRAIVLWTSGAKEAYA